MRSRNGWRAGYQESGPSGSEGGSVKPDLATNRGARFLPYKVRAYLSHRRTWELTGKRKGKPGLPGASNHPSLYQGTIELTMGEADQRERFVRLKVYTGAGWRWVNYPVRSSRYFERRRSEAGWEQQSPRLVLRKKTAELHFAQTKAIQAKKVNESKADAHLVTGAE